ncbi:hypothetical protein ACIQ6K_25575 [Streptomyces sp. NPDC096354]
MTDPAVRSRELSRSFGLLALLGAIGDRGTAGQAVEEDQKQSEK